MAVDLSLEWLGMRMASPLYNASGVMCRTREELDAVAGSAAGALITKSCTLTPREGNPEPRYHATALGSINSMGLPNEGYPYYFDYAQQFDYRKPLFVSVSGMSLEDNLFMLADLRDRHLPCLPEINLSCPNLPGKPQLAYDFAATAEALEKISQVYPGAFGVKLPPYFDPVHFAQMAALLNRFEGLRFVTCINSVGNGLLIDLASETTLISPKGGLGGLGGDYVLPTALANVREFARLMPDKHVIGCGGIKSGAEAFMHILCGATAVQIGTCLHEEGVGAFARIQHELAELMAQKGYQCLADFRGRLKTL
ncbi:dihydroorotate oxidase [Paludibacterium purpuratum]|uniref:dihydroorotate oxidase (fumarate) n=1 Tax=Paludibacterium purpuratum TaxID=1144873 RepID=A0A4R7BBF1_9NEIS|nr:dihydroorotate oxidase [Paludibacterium purpuratum]TDR82228.1 dihydroorotate oxidase B catalytic subunit [Paludibacterium purpuratum]